MPGLRDEQLDQVGVGEFVEGQPDRVVAGGAEPGRIEGFLDRVDRVIAVAELEHEGGAGVERGCFSSVGVEDEDFVVDGLDDESVALLGDHGLSSAAGFGGARTASILAPRPSAGSDSAGRRRRLASRAMATASGGASTSVEPARHWRVASSELVSGDVWDVAFLDVIAPDARVVAHHSSGDAGPGYEVGRAFRPDASWWGGRPAPGGGESARCFLGAEFDRPTIPHSIALTHTAGPHRATRAVVEASDDGESWRQVASAELFERTEQTGQAHPLFYAPAGVPSAPAWRIVATSTGNDFAWDVNRLKLLRSGVEVDGAFSSSGDAGAAYEVGNVARDDAAFWGGRADADGRFHVTFEAPPNDATCDVEIDRIVLDQGADHWVSSLVLEHQTPDGEWSAWRQLGGLGPGMNDVLLGVQPRRVVSEPAPASDAMSRFGPFDDRRILVLIAAYRDPEVAETVSSALAQAAYPEHLRFAICLQYDDDTRHLLDRWNDDPRFDIDAVHHSESRGCCWARNRTFARYDDEPYILQVDAHMRFAARWDVRYIEMLESLDNELGVLSSYPPRYTLADDGGVEYDLESGVQRLYVDQVHPDLTTTQKTVPITDASQPEPSPVVAAGQLFARGSFCRDVNYDPDIYFSGEEISLAARAFTSGYDLFAPTQNLVWHLYQHEHPKHWEDHRDHTGRHEAAVERLRTLFQGDHHELGEFGLGTVRSLADYEEHAGIRLGARRVSAEGSVTITVDREIIEPRDDYAAFVIVFLDADGSEVDRREVRAPDVLGLTRDSVTLSNVSERAVDHLVIPLTSGGTVGELAVRSVPVGASGTRQRMRRNGAR